MVKYSLWLDKLVSMLAHYGNDAVLTIPVSTKQHQTTHFVRVAWITVSAVLTFCIIPTVMALSSYIIPPGQSRLACIGLEANQGDLSKLGDAAGLPAKIGAASVKVQHFASTRSVA